MFGLFDNSDGSIDARSHICVRVNESKCISMALYAVRDILDGTWQFLDSTDFRRNLLSIIHICIESASIQINLNANRERERLRDWFGLFNRTFYSFALISMRKRRRGKKQSGFQLWHGISIFFDFSSSFCSSRPSISEVL